MGSRIRKLLEIKHLEKRKNYTDIARKGPKHQSSHHSDDYPTISGRGHSPMERRKEL